PTRLPFSPDPRRARLVERFAVRFDLPVPPRKECTEMILPIILPQVFSLAYSTNTSRSGHAGPDDQRHPEADERLPLVGRQRVAVGGAAGDGLVPPRAPAQDAEPGRGRAGRLLPRRPLIVSRVVPVGTPLPDVAVHVI